MEASRLVLPGDEEDLSKMFEHHFNQSVVQLEEQKGKTNNDNNMLAKKGDKDDQYVAAAAVVNES